VFLLDTDVLSNLRKEKKSPTVQAWIQATAATDLATTVVTVAEIQCGIERQMPNRQAYAEETQRWLDAFLAVSGMDVIPLGLQAALLLAKMHETPSLRNFVVADPRQRKSKTPADLAIAAIAIAEDAIIVTGNDGHFEQIHEVFPLPGIYNPFKATWVIQPTRDDGYEM
jgi:predicted nucleic acid-binding protein